MLSGIKENNVRFNYVVHVYKNQLYKQGLLYMTLKSPQFGVLKYLFFCQLKVFVTHQLLLD